MSLLVMGGTSVPENRHQRVTGNRPQNQMSLLATSDTSFPPSRQRDNHKSDQMSLLVTVGTSFQAGYRTMRKVERFLKRYTDRLIVDWGRERPHYGGAVG